MQEFGAFIQCKDCQFECNIRPCDTIAELRFRVKSQSRACGDKVIKFKPYVYESEDRIRGLLVNL